MATYPLWPRSKDPDDILDYSIDWTRELDGDTISTSVWVVPSGLTDQNTSSASSTKTTVWLSGGTDGTSYNVRNRITTAAGRTLDQTVTLNVKAR